MLHKDENSNLQYSLSLLEHTVFDILLMRVLFTEKYYISIAKRTKRSNLHQPQIEFISVCMY